MGEVIPMGDRVARAEGSGLPETGVAPGTPRTGFLNGFCERLEGGFDGIAGCPKQ